MKIQPPAQHRRSRRSVPELTATSAAICAASGATTAACNASFTPTRSLGSVTGTHPAATTNASVPKASGTPGRHSPLLETCQYPEGPVRHEQRGPFCERNLGEDVGASAHLMVGAAAGGSDPTVTSPRTLPDVGSSRCWSKTPPSDRFPSGGAVSTDVGLDHLLTLSTGEKVSNPRHKRQDRARLAKAQRALAKKREVTGRTGPRPGARWPRSMLGSLPCSRPDLRVLAHPLPSPYVADIPNGMTARTLITCQPHPRCTAVRQETELTVGGGQQAGVW
jgi:hypothetical protein